MKRIRRRCRTLREAERYQNRLYDRYEHVRLVHCPLTDESGEYVWEVR